MRRSEATLHIPAYLVDELQRVLDLDDIREAEPPVPANQILYRTLVPCWDFQFDVRVETTDVSATIYVDLLDSNGEVIESLEDYTTILGGYYFDDGYGRQFELDIDECADPE